MRIPLTCALALALLAAAPASTAESATETRAWQFAKPGTPPGLAVENLFGDVQVVGGSGEAFHVTAKVTIEAGDRAEAERLLRAIEFRTRDAGMHSRFEVYYPEASFPELYYADGPTGWWGGRMYASYLGRRVQLTGERGEAPSVRVDLMIRAPAGSRLAVDNVFGAVVAEGHSGELRLDTSRGLARSTGGRGRLEIDTGSGDAEVEGHEGEVRADTGSGAITVRDCRCEIAVDTGSGAVLIRGGEGRVSADTGSGSVTIEDFTGAIEADTGSGSLKARGVSAVASLDVDTGSGAVSVEGDLSALARLRVDTGSGSVRLLSSSAPDLDFTVDTGSGRVDVDIPGADVSVMDDDRWTVRSGRGGGRGIIDTGSGSVTFRVEPPAG